jgi:hypothetical protein
MTNTVIGGGAVDGQLGVNPDWPNISCPNGRTLQSVSMSGAIEFWSVEAVQKTGGQLLADGNYANPTSITGNSLDNTTLIKSLLIAQGLSGNYGFFADGFTYNFVGDVGIDVDGKIYTYAGSDPLPVAVPAGANPVGDGDYEELVFNKSSAIINDDGSTSQDTYDKLNNFKDRFPIDSTGTGSLSAPIRQVHTGYELTTINHTSESYLELSSSYTLCYLELIAAPIDIGNTTFIVDMDVLSGVLDVDFTFNLTVMDDLNRTDAGPRSTTTVYQEGKFYVTMTNAATTPNFAAFSIRALSGQAANLKIRSAVIMDGDYNVLTKSEFNLISTDTDRDGVINITDGLSFAQNITIFGQGNRVVGNNVINVSVDGSDVIHKPPYSFDFWRNVLEVSSFASRLANKVVFGKGDYYRYRNTNFLSIPRDLTLIGNDKVRFLAGKEIPASNWESIAASAGVVAYKAPYDVSSNPDSAIRAGTKQPFVSSVLREDSPNSIKPYQQQRVNSVSEVTATPFRSYFDGTDLYFSFSSSVDTPDLVAVAECDNGLVFSNPLSPKNVNMVNIEVLYPKVKCYSLTPSTYQSRKTGGKFLSFHKCAAIGSYTNAGFGNDRIDQEQIDCYTDCTHSDGYNYHFGGESLIVNSTSKSSGDDSMSHHETCVGEVNGFKSLHPAAAHSVPAFGASVVHYDCSGIAAVYGLSGKNYQSSWASLAGQDSNSYAEYNRCKTVGAGFDYSCTSQQVGQESTLVINSPITQEPINIDLTGDPNDINVYGNYLKN